MRVMPSLIKAVEVDQQAKPFVGQPQIGQKLLSVNRGENLDRLDLDDYPILDNQVGAESDVNPRHGDGVLIHGGFL